MARTIRLRLGVVGASTAAAVSWLAVSAIQGGLFSRLANAQDRPAAASLGEAREVKLSGRVVDLHTFMTGRAAGPDAARLTADRIRNGVAVALETKSGLIVLGQGSKNPARALLPLAYREVALSGKLYEKAGVKYLDVTNVIVGGPEHEEEAEAEADGAENKPAEDKAQHEEPRDDEEAEQEEAPE